MSHAAATCEGSVQDCKDAGFGVCECVDKNLEGAQKLLTCTLDPVTCDCEAE